jgi:hypothetical protein
LEMIIESADERSIKKVKLKTLDESQASKGIIDKN